MLDQISIEITEPQILTGNLFATQVSCFGFSDATISSFIQGGVIHIRLFGMIHRQRIVYQMLLQECIL